MHGKTIWKPGINEMAKASREISPGPHKEELQRPIWTPAARANMLTHVVMAYGHKTQSFMKKEVTKRAWIKPCNRGSRLNRSDYSPKLWNMSHIKNLKQNIGE